MDKPFKLTVIYGPDAVSYARSNGVEATIKELNEGDFDLEGDFCRYELDTYDDLETLKNALDTLSGWGEYYWE